MHREEKKLLDDLAKAGLGPDVVRALHPDELDNTQADQTDIAIITMDAGNIENAVDAAHTANDLIARRPSCKLVFGVNGCVDDPRELDQIPEARATLRALANALKPAAFWRFGVEQQAMMLVAMGLGRRIGTGLHVPPWLVRAP